MKNITYIIIGLFFILFQAGCGTRSMVVLIPDPDGHVGQLVVENEVGMQVLTKPNQSVQVTDRMAPPGEVKILTEEEIRTAFSNALSAQPLPPAKFILYFLQDSNKLTNESRALLPQIIQTIQDRGSRDIVISGHTDTVGSNDYNYRLSLERAKVLYGILLENGADSSSITVTSHGEGYPLIKTDDDVAEPRNRRVEVVIK
jgi:outer membrane protein OmpA-like peptidoglycan-associated protein